MKRGMLVFSVGTALLLALVVHAPKPGTASAATGLSGSARVHRASLRDTLVNGLRATRQDERDLIDRVVGYVERGQLPENVVYGAFRWARKRHPEHPFPYFVQALRVLAKRYGIVV